VQLGFLPTGVLRSRVDYQELVRFGAAHRYQAADVPDSLPNAVEIVRQAGLAPAATWGRVPSLIVADPAERAQNVETAISRLQEVAQQGIPFVMVNHRKVAGASDEENFEYARLGYTPVAEAAQQLGLKLVIEHYPDFGRNLAINPASWRRLFELVPLPSLGLCFDPSHLVFLGIDYLRAVREFGSRIHYAHAKDTEIIPEGLYQYGILAGPNFGRKPVGQPGWWRYCLPGYGQVNWGAYLGALLDVGYDGILSVEHEDDLWGWRDNPERAMEGLVVAQKYLSQFLPR
jgi:sugar phosphate isomerase/epimerase